MKRILAIAALTFTAVTVAPAPADAHHWLSRREARARAVEFVTPFVDLLDVERTVLPIMAPARHCRQVNIRTVACRFGVPLDGRTIRGRVVAHRQRDGLIGFRITPDLADFWVPSS